MELRDAIEAAIHQGRKSMAMCPSHDDGTASLSVSPGSTQRVILKCHAGCHVEDILSAAQLTWEDICEERDDGSTTDEVWTPKGFASHIYSYTDEDGTELFQALRVPLPDGKKTFFQRRWDATEKKWVWRLDDVRRVLYRLPEVLRGLGDGKTLWLLEGERDVETARMDGLLATTSPMGAGKWLPEFTEALQGADVCIVADNDDPGRAHARHVAEELVEAGCRVTVYETLIPGCKDYSDHRKARGTVESLVKVWESHAERERSTGMGIQDFLKTDFPPDLEIIPGNLARANVVFLTGYEGHGKSLFMRQFAVCCAIGLHPFSLTEMKPLKVLYIDAENPEHQQVEDWSKLAGIAARLARREVPNENLTIFSEWQAEPDLSSPAGQAWLWERVRAYEPDLVCMGPVQNLVAKNVTDDEVVRKLKHAVNTARAICGSAFLIEHHAPHRMAGDKQRSVRPYGSSLFMKWPDMGYGLLPVPDQEGTYEMEPWRKSRVRRRQWPERFRWGKPNTLEFPWVEAEPDESGSVIVAQFGHPL